VTGGPLWRGDDPAAAPGYVTPPPPGAGGALPADRLGPTVQQGDGLRLAGWWRRAGAALIDLAILVAGALALLTLLGKVFSVGILDRPTNDVSGLIAVLVALLVGVSTVAIVAMIYAPLLMARTNGQTLGRMATGIRVVRTNGRPMDFGWAMFREVAVKALLFHGAGLALTGGIAGLLDVLWPLWDEENRALHDFVVQTRTVLA